MLENYVALSITNILAMLLLAFVVGRNNLLDRKMKRFFSTAIFCTILVILAEIGTSVFGQPVASFSLPNMVFNVLGFCCFCSFLEEPLYRFCFHPSIQPGPAFPYPSSFIMRFFVS